MTLTRTGHAAAGSWQDRSACAGLTDLFFPATGRHLSRTDPDIARAVAICDGCPVKTECLTFAVKRGESDGIWGGALPSERAFLAGFVHRESHLAGRLAAGPLQALVERLQVDVARHGDRPDTGLIVWVAPAAKRAYYRAVRAGSITVRQADRITSQLGGHISETWPTWHHESR